MGEKRYLILKKLSINRKGKIYIFYLYNCKHKTRRVPSVTQAH